MSTWRLQDLFVEATRNVTRGRVRSVLLALATAGLVGALVFTELSTTDELLAFQDEFIDSGGNMFIATSEEGLASSRCAALASTQGVIGSASVTSGPPMETTLAPGTPFSTGRVTTGALGLFSREPATPVADVVNGWIVGSFGASELGVT